MENVYMLSDAEIIKKISAKIKELRLKQNISRQDLATSSCVSLPSIAHMESGEIKSFESFLRIVRSLGKIEIFAPLLQAEEISPNEYYKMVQSASDYALQIGQFSCTHCLSHPNLRIVCNT